MTRPLRPRDSGTPSAQAPESYFWPLVALVLVILPQVLVPGRFREGPPLVVPVIEATVFLALLVVAAKPGPVPRAARPLILSLFAVLILANSAAAARLVVVVLRTPSTGQAPPSVTQLLVGTGIVLATNIVTFGLLYWQLDSGGPSGRLVHSKPYPESSFPKRLLTGWRRRAGSHGSKTTCTWPTPTSWRSARLTPSHSLAASRD
jgi:hypothetical protein